MAKRSDVVAEQLGELKQDLRDLWQALTRDPGEEVWKERRWLLLSGALTTAATIGARKATAKVWGILTGEPPPNIRDAQRQARRG